MWTIKSLESRICKSQKNSCYLGFIFIIPVEDSEASMPKTQPKEFLKAGLQKTKTIQLFDDEAMPDLTPEKNSNSKGKY